MIARMLFLFATLLVTVPAWTARANIPEPPHFLIQATPESATVMIVPGGGGPTLAEQGVEITVTMLDLLENPIVGFPASDLWLGDAVGGVDLSRCPNSMIADGPTDATGTTTFNGALSGGGYTESGVQVYFAGIPDVFTTLDLRVNSPDITGDRVVDLFDLALFAEDVLGAYHFRSDLHADGVLDLSDVGEFALHYGAGCP